MTGNRETVTELQARHCDEAYERSRRLKRPGHQKFECRGIVPDSQARLLGLLATLLAQSRSQRFPTHGSGVTFLAGDGSYGAQEREVIAGDVGERRGPASPRMPAAED